MSKNNTDSRCLSTCCSAGVGRTGTLIAIDILTQNIRDKRKVDIFGTVLNLRKQRMMMVQSEVSHTFNYLRTSFHRSATCQYMQQLILKLLLRYYFT